MKVWGAGSTSEQLLTEQRIAPSRLRAFLISFAGYRGCALLAKNLFFSFHKVARESLTKDSPTCFSVLFGAFFPMLHFQLSALYHVWSLLRDTVFPHLWLL